MNAVPVSVALAAGDRDVPGLDTLKISAPAGKKIVRSQASGRGRAG
jgi:hypothetical protein